MNKPATHDARVTPSLRDIEAAVCARFGLTPEILRGPRRERGIARPRQIVMYLAREMTPLSYPRIAAWFHRDHTTVLWGERRIRQLMVEKPKVAAYVRECRALKRGVFRNARTTDSCHRMVAMAVQGWRTTTAVAC